MKKDIDAHLAAAIDSASRAQGWSTSRGGLLVALSGGGDSMALLELLRNVWGGRVGAAHLEHGFRGEESEADAKFVESYCSSIGVELDVERADVSAHRARGESAEMAGRRARYVFFERVREARGYDFIATGHTKDDSVETVIFNFFRGTGIKGLSGIPPRTGRVVRPIIGCSRADLRRYLELRGIEWREDSTNAENDHRRNMIRNELLPWVKDHLNATPERAILGISSECAELAEDVEARASMLCDEITVEGDVGIAAWDIRAARKLSRSDLARAVREQGRRLSLPTLDRARTDVLVDLIFRSGRWRFQWAGTTEAAAIAGQVVWLDRSDAISI